MRPIELAQLSNTFEKLDNLPKVNDYRQPILDEINEIRKITDVITRNQALITLLPRICYDQTLCDIALAMLDLYQLDEYGIGSLVRNFLENTDLEFEAFAHINFDELVARYFYISRSELAYFIKDLYNKGATDLVRHVAEAAKNPTSHFLELYGASLRAIDEENLTTTLEICLAIAEMVKDLGDFWSIDWIVYEAVGNSEEISDSDLELVKKIIAIRGEQRMINTILFLAVNSAEIFEEHKNLISQQLKRHSVKGNALIASIVHSPKSLIGSLDQYNLKSYTLVQILNEILELRPDLQQDISDFVFSAAHTNGNLDDWAELLAKLDIRDKVEEISDLLEKEDIAGYSYEYYPLLARLKELGFDAMAQHYAKIINSTEGEKFVAEKFAPAPLLIENILEIIKSESVFRSLDVTTQAEFLSEVTNFLNQLTHPQLLFILLIVSKYGFISQMTKNLVQGQTIKAAINKTGSNLIVLARKNLQGIFINEIPTTSFAALKLATENHVPVSPTIKSFHLQRQIVSVEGNATRMYTRYCGPSVVQFLDAKGYYVIGMVVRIQGITAPEQGMNQMYFADDELLNEIYAQVEKIMQRLEVLGIEHGHPHMGNFTLELIDSKYLQEHLDKSESATINNIAYKEDKFNFNPDDYYELLPGTNKRRWTLVVRLIDWDRAEIK